MSVTDLTPGTELETVLLGSLTGDVLRIWRSDGQAECRQVRQPELVRKTLGRGLLARTSPEANRFREVGLLDAKKDVLILLGRGQVQSGADQVTTGAETLQARPCRTPSPDPATWTAWGRWLGHLLLAAAGRGEFLVVETGGWDAVNEPYVLMGVFPDAAGTWLSQVEAVPAPADPPWTAPVEGRTGSSISAPANRENVSVAGLLAIQAIGMWAASPYDVVLTFGHHPMGPWPLEASATGATGS